MNSWILIITVLYGNAPSVTHVEFKMKQGCEIAATSYKTETETVFGRNRTFSAICVENIQ